MFNVSKIYHRESIVAERNHKLLFPCCLIKKKMRLAQTIPGRLPAQVPEVVLSSVSVDAVHFNICISTSASL